MTERLETMPKACGSRHFRADVRLVRAPDRKRSGLQRGVRVIWFPDEIGDLVWDKGPDMLGPDLRMLLDDADMLAAGEEIAGRSDRNAAFLAALCPQVYDLSRFQATDFVMVGCGGLGSQIAIQLAALGARRFLLIDGDRIEASNLNRLTFAAAEDIGLLKTEVLARYLVSRFSASVETVPEFATGADAVRSILQRTRLPFVLLAGDDARLARSFLAACHRVAPTPPPYLHVGYVGAHCMAGPLVAQPEDACPFCGSAAEITADEGFVAPSALANNALIAGFAVSQIAMERLTGRSALSGHRWLLDLQTGRTRLRPVLKHLQCKVCHP